MFTKVKLFMRMCSQITKPSLNSINPISQFVAFGHYFPKEWSEEYIQQQLDPSKRNIKEIQLIKNKLGLATGKVLLKFMTEKAMKACIQRYNEDFIITKEGTHRVIIKPFQLKTKMTIREHNQKRTKNQVKIKNLDFDINAQELERLAKDFGKVQFIDINIRQNGLNDGLATIHFSKRSQSQDFAYFCNGLLYKQRKLKAEVIQLRAKSQQTIQYLKQPTTILESHDYVFRKCVQAQKNMHFANSKQQQ